MKFLKLYANQEMVKEPTIRRPKIEENKVNFTSDTHDLILYWKFHVQAMI